METLTILSIVVGVAGLLVGVIQIILTLMQYKKNKKEQKNPTCADEIKQLSLN